MITEDANESYEDTFGKASNSTSLAARILYKTWETYGEILLASDVKGRRPRRRASPTKNSRFDSLVYALNCAPELAIERTSV